MKNSRKIDPLEITSFFANHKKESAIPANSFNDLAFPDPEIDLLEEYPDAFGKQRMADGSPILIEKQKKFKKKK
jgi:hypothetical protein